MGPAVPSDILEVWRTANEVGLYNVLRPVNDIATKDNETIDDVECCKQATMKIQPL